MNILFIGDIFGKAGREIVEDLLPELRQRHRLDFIVANGENIAHGLGVTRETAQALFKSGVHVVTTGNHAFDQVESHAYFKQEPRLLRPENFSKLAPGRGYVVQEVYAGVKIAVINLIGRVHMDPADCPFAAADRVLAEVHGEADIVFVDMHAEATSEARAMGWYLDGRVAAVLGSHSHVQTADEEILPKGTAYLTDAGMTGPYHSIIGIKIEASLQKFTTQVRAKFEPATGSPRFCGAIVEVEESTGLARKIERIQIRK